jgi:uncharacterized membrane protein
MWSDMMVQLALASGLFLASHLGLSVPPVRTALTDRIGETGFRLIYSLIALALLLWMVFAYRAAPPVFVWQPSTALQHLSLTIMPFACILLVAGLATPNPSALGSEQPHVAAAGPVGILAITRHPVMWGIALWGAAHLLANGDAPAMILFGSLTVLALAGAILQDWRKRELAGEAWAAFARRSSYLPFAAMATGRVRTGLREIGYGKMAGGLALYAVLLVLHPWLFGVSPFAPPVR